MGLAGCVLEGVRGEAKGGALMARAWEKKGEPQQVIAVGKFALDEFDSIKPNQFAGSTSPMDALITASARCVKCDAKYGACDCWVQCRCGRMVGKGELCGNEVHRCHREVKGQRCVGEIGHRERHEYVKGGR